jgi:peptide deformylase
MPLKPGARTLSKMLEIVKAPNPILSQKTKPVAKIDKTILKLIGQMEESLAAASDPIGVGLAAPQIGKSLSIFIAKPTPKSRMFVFINPKITAKKPLPEETDKEKPRKLEGCLSLMNIWGEVERAPEIFVEYLDEAGKAHKRKFRGFMATVIQHEVDHLSGILFPKRVLEQGGTLYQSSKNPKGEDIFEEIKI